MNSINFTGNLGQDAEVRAIPSGKKITTFSVALSSGWGDNKITTWMRCNLWGDRGEKVAQYLTKGSQVGVSGEFSAREWTDKEGVVKTSCEVNVQDVTLLGGSGNNAKPVTEQPVASKVESGADFNDDIPF